MIYSEKQIFMIDKVKSSEQTYLEAKVGCAL